MSRFCEGLPQAVDLRKRDVHSQSILELYGQAARIISIG